MVDSPYQLVQDFFHQQYVYMVFVISFRKLSSYPVFIAFGILYLASICFRPENIHFVPQKFELGEIPTMAPANWWLEDYFLFGKAFFSGAMLVYLRVESNSSRHDLQNKGKKASVSETVTWRLQNTRFFKDISLASRYPWTVTRYSVSNTSSTQELRWVLVLC